MIKILSGFSHRFLDDNLHASIRGGLVERLLLYQLLALLKIEWFR